MKKLINFWFDIDKNMIECDLMPKKIILLWSCITKHAKVVLKLWKVYMYIHQLSESLYAKNTNEGRKPD